MKITSVNNDLVKETAKLLKTKYRDESGLFLIEGEKGVSEALFLLYRGYRHRRSLLSRPESHKSA